LRRADPPSKQSYQMSKNRFISSRSQSLNRKKPEGLVRIYFTNCILPSYCVQYFEHGAKRGGNKSALYTVGTQIDTRSNSGCILWFSSVPPDEFHIYVIKETRTAFIPMFSSLSCITGVLPTYSILYNVLVDINSIADGTFFMS